MGAETYRFDEFIIDSMIGEGGMGKVFRARQVSLDRWVALKVLVRAKETGTFTDRFYHEAKAAAKLIHPNILQIYTVGEYEGIPYYAMEYVDGSDLEHMLHTQAGDEPLNNDEIIEIMRSMLKAMVLAGEHAIVHRDIKPANILITKSGSVKIMDFGLAKSLDHSLTQSGLIVGTPSYMSPEQGGGKPVDARSDLYSLGCVLYACIAGRPPFAADSVAALLFQHAYEPPKPPAENRPEIHIGLQEICYKLLAKLPDARYQSAGEALEALAKVPSNSTAAELSLAKRAQKAQQIRASQQKDDSAISPESVAGVLIPLLPELGGAASSDAPTTIQEVPTLPKNSFLSGTKTSTTPPPHAAPDVVEASKPRTTGSPSFMATKTQKLTPLSSITPASSPAVSAESAAPPAAAGLRPASSSGPLTHSSPPAPGLHAPDIVPAVARDSHGASTAVGTPQPMPAVGTTTPTSLPAVGTPSSMPAVPPPPRGRESSVALSGVDSGVRRRMMRIDDTFIKMADGRWSYRLELGRCPHAEGMATALPAAAGEKAEGLGDCLLCSNWSRRTGCGVATMQIVERQTRYTGLKLVIEQTIVWASIGRFDKAVSLLSDYIKSHPYDPEGYRELARLYDRPDFKSREKRRAIVLYQRFAEMAKGIPNFNKIEITRAEERAAAMAATPAPPEVKATFVTPASGTSFTCFFRGPLLCFAFGVLTLERLLILRAGDVDPESGIQAADMGGAMDRASSIFRRFKSENAKKEEQVTVKRELTRLSELPLEALQNDSARVLSVGTENVTDVKLSVDQAIGTRCVSMHAPQAFQLLFTEAHAFKAEQLAELLRRHIAARK